ncbi:hypothetical protein LJC19_04090 [Oxalobacter sp. OttesenSCG-928-P03]|nr:hypothetical protein [Oxalobacter sp. OttesenSCG-928-P03]
MLRIFHCFLAVLFSVFALSAQAGEYVDMFPGTLVIWEDKPVLIRCDLVKNAYVLVDSDLQTAPYLEQVKELQASIESPVSARVYGSYREINGMNHLVVRSMENIRKGDSCHLVPPKLPLNITFP